MSSKIGTSSPGKRNSSSVPDSPSKRQKKNSGGLKVSPKKDDLTRDPDISLGNSRRQLFQPTSHDIKQEKSEALKPSGTTDASGETPACQSARDDQSGQQVSTGQGCVVNLQQDHPVPEKSGVKKTAAIGQLTA